MLKETEGKYSNRLSGVGYRAEVLDLVKPNFKGHIKVQIGANYPSQNPECQNIDEVNYFKQMMVPVLLIQRN